MSELETIEGIGEVTRVVPPGSEGDKTPGMGVVFIELTSASERLVHRPLTRRDR